MFCIPAHMFNRMIILVPMALTLIIGSNRYDEMLTENGYQPAGDKLEDF